MEPGVRVTFRMILAAIAMALVSFGLAQEQRLPAARDTASVVVETTQTATAGTGESLSFIGKKLWFEMRKRLNLTTQEEERKQRETERSYRLKIGGIKLEKPD